MITRTHALPVVRQCQLLELARSTAYVQPRPVSAADLALMRRIDAWHLAAPFAGVRMLRDLLRREGHRIGRKRVRTIMARMGIDALYRKPHTSQRHPAHRVYPYLLRPSGDHTPQPCVGGRYQCAMQARLETDQLRRLVADRQLECCPAREGLRAEGGCKAPPGADGGVS